MNSAALLIQTHTICDIVRQSLGEGSLKNLFLILFLAFSQINLIGFRFPFLSFQKERITSPSSQTDTILLLWRALRCFISQVVNEFSKQARIIINNKN